MQKEMISVFWFRRDLRLDDNKGLFEALNCPFPVLPLFIFDSNILEGLEETDARITFIVDQLTKISTRLKAFSSSLYCGLGTPELVWKQLLSAYEIKEVYANEDYEPYAIERDKSIEALLACAGIKFKLFKDQVIFAKSEILKADFSPYTIYTPYKHKWMASFNEKVIHNIPSASGSHFIKASFPFPSLSELGFARSSIQVRDHQLDDLEDYEKNRNYPALNQTSHLSPHLRFGTISIRTVVRKIKTNQVFLNELIWREFFMQILFHFPKIVHSNFKSKYDHLAWRNNEDDFEKWKKGETGFPLVDAGIRELNATGYMHNRVRMVVAGFLCKHLLIDWKWGEAYFAKKLLDYELSSNNGNWQWAAGTGCDAAPYFRVFNPSEQVKKFDPKLEYISKWIPEINTLKYPGPMVDHKMARERAIQVYKSALYEQ